MIQDIAPHMLKNPYRPDLRPQAGDALLIRSGGAFLLRYDERENRIALPRVGLLPNELREKLVYFFALDDEAFFWLDAPVTGDEISLPSTEGWVWYSARDLRRLDPQPLQLVYAAFTADHLAEWYDSSRYCGCCGAPTAYDATERAMTCTRCARKIYPRINPAVIVGVVSGDRLLVTRYRTGYGSDALVAGFCEIGETLEETVQREVMEETGLRVKNIRYYKSQPWGIAADLLAGFFCEAEGDDGIRVDEGELRSAQWKTREEISFQTPEYSLTGEMMRVFAEGRV